MPSNTAAEGKGVADQRDVSGHLMVYHQVSELDGLVSPFPGCGNRNMIILQHCFCLYPDEDTSVANMGFVLLCRRGL